MPTATELREGVSSLVTLANADLDRLWREVNDAVAAREALSDVLPALIETYGSAAATFAADWYDDLRDEAGVPRRFRAIPAEVGPSGAEALAGWGISPLFAEKPDWDAAKTLIKGGLQRRIANASRVTITVSSVQDPSAAGWQRAGRGECAFCRMLIDRGAVYSETTADFASHDHCHCTAVPAFEGQERPVQPYRKARRDISDADRARVRAYLRAH